jgi:hypothetical protein
MSEGWVDTSAGGTPLWAEEIDPAGYVRRPRIDR